MSHDSAPWTVDIAGDGSMLTLAAGVECKLDSAIDGVLCQAREQQALLSNDTSNQGHCVGG